MLFLLVGSAADLNVPFILELNANGSHSVLASVNSTLGTQIIPEYSADVTHARCGQVPEIEYNIVKIKDLKEMLNTRIEPDNSLIHDEALLMVARLSGPGDSKINQICSIYEYLKNGNPPVKGWIYINDPRGLDYLNYANESVRIGDKTDCTGDGDCDDFAVLIASLMESIGMTTRIILANNNSTSEHIYAEVYLGNLNSQGSQVNDALDWLKQKYSTNNIFTYNDTDTGDVWLNLDWGQDEKGNEHPGGAFRQADGKMVIWTSKYSHLG